MFQSVVRKRHFIVLALLISFVIIALNLGPVGKAKSEPSLLTDFLLPKAGNSTFLNSLGEGMSNPELKIGPQVIRDTAKGERTSVVIFLADQADVSAANGMKDQDARGWYVYNTLSEHAARTQAGIKALLDSESVTYQSFWAANMLVANADRLLIERLAARSDVARIDSNKPARWIEDDTIADFHETSDKPESPTTTEWGVQNVNAPAVWAMGFTGQGIVIGDLDTGTRWTHVALKPQYRGWNGTTADHNYNWHDSIHSGGGSCGANNIAPCDDSGHGTHTAGSIVGDDGAGNQIGVAPGAKWMGCRNMNVGDGTPASYTECFQFTIAPTDSAGNNPNPTLRPHVLNNSWTCPASEGCTTRAELETIVNNTTAAGIFVEASAGNAGPGCSSVSDAPAIYSSAFSTGAISINNSLVGFSSRGPSTYYNPDLLKPNVSAPGSNVRSSYNSSDSSFASLSGTSMAGPHVVGVVALLWSAHPELARNIEATKTLLQNTANPDVSISTGTQTCGGTPSTDIPNNSFGYGRVDALAAVMAAGPTPTPTVTATATPTSTATATFTPTPTNTPTNTPTATATSTSTPTNTPTATPTAGSTPQYQIIDIGVVQVGDSASQGFGVSSGGVGTGTSIRSNVNQAFTWTQGGGIVGLPNIAARDFCRSNGATDTGTVVGTCSTTFFGSARLPVVWQNGVVSQLPLPAGQSLGDAWDVNSSGVAVGSVDGGISQFGAIYDNGVGSVITQTTSNGSYFQVAYGINDSGRIAGVGLDPTNASINVAIVHDMSTNTTFGITPLQGDTTALAFAVGNGGHVVGASGFNGRPFIWSDANGTVEIPLPVGTSQGSARGVNSTGWVVGRASSAFSIPFVWNGTATYRLADLIPSGTGWDLSMNTSSSADAISDNGIIVGTGVLNGAVHAFAMIPGAGPTPSPTSTPTNTPTSTPTATATSTPTNTPTSTPTATATSTPTNTPTSTPTATSTPTPTATATATPTSTPIPSYKPRADFDGDGRSDLSVFRPSEGNWYLLGSTSGFTGLHFGETTDIPSPGDFDGDGKTDISVFRPSNGFWYRIDSRDNTVNFVEFGLNGDIPIAGDFDGDGNDDQAVFRPSNGTWYWLRSIDGQFAGMQFGQNGDRAIVGDFDGDGKDDLSVFRGSTWYRMNSSNGSFYAEAFGIDTDMPVPGDYDGDNKDDIAVFRPSNGNWYAHLSGSGAYTGINWGINGDIPVPGDYDGDNLDDVAVYRNGTWYMNLTSQGPSGAAFGLSGDTPILKKYIP